MAILTTPFRPRMYQLSLLPRPSFTSSSSIFCLVDCFPSCISHTYLSYIFCLRDSLIIIFLFLRPLFPSTDPFHAFIALETGGSSQQSPRTHIREFLLLLLLLQLHHQHDRASFRAGETNYPLPTIPTRTKKSAHPPRIISCHHRPSRNCCNEQPSPLRFPPPSSIVQCAQSHRT